jgi:hypothetical protein
MKDEPDLLEVELYTLRPRAISPELRRRIGEQIESREGFRADESGSRKPTLPGRSFSAVPGRWLVLAGSLAAACLLAFVWWRGAGRGVEPPGVSVGIQLVPRVEDTHVDVLEGATGDSVPVLMAYQRALARSPEALEVLLDRQALATPSSDPELVRIGALTRSDAALHSLLGDD